jgi:hypothetical protein
VAQALMMTMSSIAMPFLHAASPIAELASENNASGQQPHSYNSAMNR